ncbi:MAG: CRTAC1 family protein [candidate division WS1 bacterium]|jgi:hypothetical protein|nr:CRTAC1 family protein [candidate division WS1 bacterium]
MTRLTASLLLALLPLTLSADPLFRDATEQVGLSGGGQAAWADYDGDGWVDVLIGRTLFRNIEGERFEAVALPEGVGGTGGTWGDFDNDGDLDLFTFGSTFALAINNGDGSFTRSEGLPEIPVVASRGACWVDLNADGLLDLYIGGYEKWEESVYLDAILISEGDGTFSLGWQSSEEGKRSARGVTAADFDDDGDADVYVSNYRLQPNQLWLNTGELPMTEVGAERGVAGVAKSAINYTGGIRYPVSGHTIGSAWGDLDDDGWLDLFVGNFSHPPAYQDRPQFLRNSGPPDWTFEDMSEGAGLAWQESFASPALADFDNDGDLDLYFTTVYQGDRSVLYRNDGGWQFTDVTADAGIEAARTYQAAWADFDNDGDLDLLTGGKLYENAGPVGNWLRLKLEGPGSAIGAVARVRVGERILTRQVESSTGEGNQSEMVLHFGLGENDSPVEVEITWPGGQRQTITARPTQVTTVTCP